MFSDFFFFLQLLNILHFIMMTPLKILKKSMKYSQFMSYSENFWWFGITAPPTTRQPDKLSPSTA